MKSLVALTLALAGASTAVPGHAKGPDLNRCPAPRHTADSEVQRTGPLPVPPELRTILKADRFRYGLLTLSGATLCSDTSSIESVEDMELSPDGRFLSFGWIGYEVYGHELIDRLGAGAVHEVGARPVFSPTRVRFAAVDQTESEFGSLSGLAVWSVGPAAVRLEAQFPDIPRMNDWRIDGWRGETCLALSSIPQSRTPQDYKQWGSARRDRFVASFAQERWTFKAGKACPAK